MRHIFLSSGLLRASSKDSTNLLVFSFFEASGEDSINLLILHSSGMSVKKIQALAWILFLYQKVPDDLKKNKQSVSV